MLYHIQLLDLTKSISILMALLVKRIILNNQYQARSQDFLKGGYIDV